MAGQGWRMLVECLSVGRGITLPSNSTGGLKSVAMGIGAYAHIRRQFKISIGKMEGIEEPLARIAGNAYVMDAAASLITYGIMLGEKPAVLSAIVKYHCTHRAQQSIIDAMDIAGGKGIMLGEGNFGAWLSGRTDRHHRRRGKHPDPQHDDLRRGRFAVIRTCWRRWPPRRTTTWMPSTSCCSNISVM